MLPPRSYHHQAATNPSYSYCNQWLAWGLFEPQVSFSPYGIEYDTVEVRPTSQRYVLSVHPGVMPQVAEFCHGRTLGCHFKPLRDVFLVQILFVYIHGTIFSLYLGSIYDDAGLPRAKIHFSRGYQCPFDVLVQISSVTDGWDKIYANTTP